MTEQNEIWKDVEGYEGLYQVSNMGNVKMTGRSWVANGITMNKGERVITPFLANNGYHRVTLVKNKNSTKKFPAHRLVAQAFIHNVEGKKEVNHINGVKTDNRAVNLEWVTRSENAFHAVKMGFIKPMKRGNNPNAKRIRCDTLDIVFDCAPDAGDALGLNESSIKKVANGIRKHIDGLVFSFV